MNDKTTMIENNVSGIPEGINTAAMRESYATLFRLTLVVLICTFIPNFGDSLLSRALIVLQSVTPILAGFAIAFSVFLMGKQFPQYKTAGIFLLISRFSNYFINVMIPFLVSAVFPVEFTVNAMVLTLVSLGISILTSVLYYIGVYKLYRGHSEILGGLDLDLTHKWKILFVIELVLAVVYPVLNPVVTGMTASSSVLNSLTVWLMPILFNAPVYGLNCLYLRRMMNHFES